MGNKRYNHPLWAFLIAGTLFLMLCGFLSLPFLVGGGESLSLWTLEAGGDVKVMEVPFLIRTGGSETYRMTARVDSLEGKVLCIAGLDVNVLSARMDGVLLYRAGDPAQPTANLWNSMFLIPLPDRREGGNVLTLEMTGNFFISMTRPPFLVDRSRGIFAYTLHRFIYHDLIILFMGAALLTGIASLLSGMTAPGKRIDDILFGVASLVIVIYALEFTYRESTGPFGLYVVLKRVFISCAFLGAALYLASIDYHCNRCFRLSRWTLGPSVISFLLPLSLPSFSQLMRVLPSLNIMLIVHFIIILIILIRSRNCTPLYLIPMSLIILSMIQVTYSVILRPGLPQVLPYAIVLSVTLFGIQFARERSRIRVERDYLKNAFNRDPLTGAYNRRILDNINLESFSHAVFLDFDNFKYYNDRYGHDRGDDLLRSFVFRAKGLLRGEDLLIRFGGDEFLILFRETGDVDASAITERIRRRFVLDVGDEMIDLSYGISPVREKNGLDLKNLDGRMYAMKQERKNRSRQEAVLVGEGT